MSSDASMVMLQSSKKQKEDKDFVHKMYESEEGGSNEVSSDD
jgi:stress response protein SCP2